MKSLLPIFLACSLAVVSCAKPRHTAVVVDVALLQVMTDIHVAEQSALCGLPSCAGSNVEEFLGGWTRVKSIEFNKALLPAVESGKQFNEVLRNWKRGQSMPVNVAVLISSLGQALSRVTADFPASSQRESILAGIAKGQMMILQGLSIAMMIGGQ